MFLSNELIDTIPLCRESITLPGYLGKMKRELQGRYASLIKSLDIEPVFFVAKDAPKHDPLPRVNKLNTGRKK